MKSHYRCGVVTPECSTFLIAKPNMPVKSLSIIIPTLNEEKQISLLLDSLKKQNFKNYEIIIADAGSKDKTIEITKKYKCKITKGGLPSRGRNEGAKIAQSDILLFLDADVSLPERFLENSLKEFSVRKLGIAGFFLVPDKGLISKILFFLFYNFPILILEKILPHAAMGIMVKREIFKEVGGFDENIKLAEDHYFAREAQKISKFRIVKSTKIYISTRRFKKDGWLRTGVRYFLCELHMIFLGPVKSNIFNYNYTHLKK
jgi:glycosyltransferase involved in cell wall biosynthesis